jgi:hypothetical protein
VQSGSSYSNRKTNTAATSPVKVPIQPKKSAVDITLMSAKQFRKSTYDTSGQAMEGKYYQCSKCNEFTVHKLNLRTCKNPNCVSNAEGVKGKQESKTEQLDAT